MVICVTKFHWWLVMWTKQTEIHKHILWTSILTFGFTPRDMVIIVTLSFILPSTIRLCIFHVRVYVYEAKFNTTTNWSIHVKAWGCISISPQRVQELFVDKNIPNVISYRACFVISFLFVSVFIPHRYKVIAYTICRLPVFRFICFLLLACQGWQWIHSLLILCVVSSSNRSKYRAHIMDVNNIFTGLLIDETGGGPSQMVNLASHNNSRPAKYSLNSDDGLACFLVGYCICLLRIGTEIRY